MQDHRFIVKFIIQPRAGMEESIAVNVVVAAAQGEEEKRAAEAAWDEVMTSLKRGLNGAGTLTLDAVRKVELVSTVEFPLNFINARQPTGQ
ncbi:MAG: hypothetical protein A3C84_02130 [Candidatus Ryanbacteria bacterium RIFCSPHIGHO2_02_FULL_48_12]|uniref:Uncharacterized protein n=1 Tax=Candidatus Ryanbacteria bacterium RIFCSPHIGHO2_01_FULL_48_27 TaxID=1802115 RepID=A0A1G2G348_9BACT|nr:MAG: hypothetical protein A2756_04560 [Candidatus Ryanbacteria bacterium RIFCSPHIGHO2_01_FULL_48_27]OGZ49251.1 MAG: hypothetical protein A3C84_02130 [Candidatus Ryanbacteria bacterium RIFCSPHIGHO2_02_FULL_48_12]